MRSVRKRTKACSLIFEYERLIYVFIRNFRLTHYPFGLLLDYGSIVCHDAMILAYLLTCVMVLGSSQNLPKSSAKRKSARYQTRCANVRLRNSFALDWTSKKALISSARSVFSAQRFARAARGRLSRTTFEGSPGVGPFALLSPP
jgi:hypothetical protein